MQNRKAGQAGDGGRGLSRRSVIRAGAGALAAPMLLSRPAHSAGGKTIRVLLVGDPFYYALRELVGQFKDETGITAEVESLAYDALQARLVSSFIAHRPDADVITVDAMWVGQYMDSNWIRPLDDLVKGDKSLDLGDFIPEVLYSLNTWRGHMATLPVAAYGQGVMYRKDAFAALGLQMPAAKDFTWDAYVKLVQGMDGKTVGGTKLFGTVVAGAQPQPIVHMYTQLAASQGTRWFKQFPQAPWDFTPTIDSPENLGALEMFNALYKMSPPAAINFNWFDAGMRFAHGDIGMLYWWTPYFYLTWNDGYMTGKPSPIRDQIEYATLPHDPAHPQVISTGGWSLGIPANAPNQDAAWQFVKWATSAKTQKAMGLVNKVGHQFSDFSRVSLYQDPDLAKIYPYLPLQLDLLRQGDGKVVRPPCPVYTTLEGIYGLNLNRTLSGGATPKQALATTSSLFDNVLKGNFLIPYKLESFNDTLATTKQLITSLA
ncbi:MAG TPA: extracellular solute-binding protein [Acetobacteraceae bacterium]|nr:extracellular solute-binding protein [Acetobacteraceae bacterium]